jgi:hypothetical protein
VEENPVKTGNAKVLATAYVKRGDGKAARTSVLVALASWTKEPVDIRLTIDWKKLGLDPKRGILRAPAIENFQPAAEFRPGDTIRVEPGKGWLFVLTER